MRQSVISLLLEATTDASDEIVIAAIYALGEGGNNSSEVMARLESLANGKSHDIRVAAIKALGRASIRRYKI
ncbi:HEAT repeat domain-containing protein [Serratia inhibens]|uniref:HEAT repeat domain-containing protein n=1 Tax=Serratia inhibens TaxID=2338073 RepID=UPI0032166E0E